MAKTKLMWIIAFLIVTTFDAWLYSPEVAGGSFMIRFTFSAGKYIVGAIGAWFICWWLTREGKDEG